jgi:hypothetical protein
MGESQKSNFNDKSLPISSISSASDFSYFFPNLLNNCAFFSVDNIDAGDDGRLLLLRDHKMINH